MLKDSKSTYVEIQVIDTGIGIKESEMDNLFKLFGFLESSKQLNSKGIGLGLFITKQIATLFNGQIICKSKVGKGSNFIVLLALSNTQNN